MEILNNTGFKTPTEYFSETSYWDRIIIEKGIKDRNKKKYDI